MNEKIKEILELTTNQVGDIIIDYIDKNGIKQEWEYCCDKDILNYIINLQKQLQQKDKVIKAAIELLERYMPYLEKTDKAIDVFYILQEGDKK